MARASLSSECPDSYKSGREHSIGVGEIAEKIFWLQASMKGYELFTPHNSSVIDAIITKLGRKPVRIQIKVSTMNDKGVLIARPRRTYNKLYKKNYFDVYAFYVREFERFYFVKSDEVNSSYFQFKADRNILNNWQVIEMLNEHFDD